MLMPMADGDASLESRGGGSESTVEAGVSSISRQHRVGGPRRYRSSYSHRHWAYAPLTLLLIYRGQFGLSAAVAEAFW